MTLWILMASVLVKSFVSGDRVHCVLKSESYTYRCYKGFHGAKRYTNVPDVAVIYQC